MVSQLTFWGLVLPPLPRLPPLTSRPESITAAAPECVQLGASVAIRSTHTLLPTCTVAWQVSCVCVVAQVETFRPDEGRGVVGPNPAEGGTCELKMNPSADGV